MEIKTGRNSVYIEDVSGAILAEAAFPETQAGVVSITRTFVDESLRGQGVAGKLMETAVRRIRENGWKIKPVCSYAVNWFEKHPEHSGLLLK